MTEEGVIASLVFSFGEAISKALQKHEAASSLRSSQ